MPGKVIGIDLGTNNSVVGNQADALSYQVEKTVNENREKVPVGDLSKIEAAVDTLGRVAQGEDVAAIKKASSELEHLSHRLAEVLYKGSQGSQGSGGSRGSAGSPGSSGSHGSSGPHGWSGSHDSTVKEGEVVDAEYAETAQ